VALVTYSVSLTVFVDQVDLVAAALLQVFQQYWGGMAKLPGIPSDDFVAISPESSEIGEADEEDLGKDVIIGITSWTLRISEHQPAL
jgi:hypothetical protein